MKTKLYFVLALLAFGATAASAQQQPAASCPHAVHHDKMKEMNERGDHAMGFAQDKTAHHFRLLGDGGAIEVGAADAQDTASRDQIRAHLRHISRMFSEGNFDAPAFIHDQTPPGVPVMRRLKAEIEYSFEQTERGARVRIRTRNKEALAAVHDFLRFQIEEHQTGDPLEMQN